MVTWVFVEVMRFIISVSHGLIRLLLSLSIVAGECEVVLWSLLRLTVYVHLLSLRLRENPGKVSMC